MAALTVPIGLATTAALSSTDDLWIIGVVVAAALGVGGYLLAGAKLATSIATPLLIMVVATPITFAEFLLWAEAALSDDVSSIGKAFCWLGIVAIPVITTLGLVLFGRYRSRRAVG